MQHSLEAYFLINLAVDTALIAVVSRANECMRLRRVLMAGFLAASYALLTQTVSDRLTHPAIQLILLAIIGMVICQEADVRRWGSISIQLLGGTMILGGTGSLLPASGPFSAALIGAGLILVSTLLNVRCRRLLSWEVTVLIALNGRSVSFRALIDTGNRLHEPISGLPVLVAEARILGDLFVRPQTDNLSWRQIPFGALGSHGTMRCFRPDSILIRCGDQFFHAPDVWVAIYPGQIPGAARALAPPSFAVIPGGRRQHFHKIHAKRGD